MKQQLLLITFALAAAGAEDKPEILSLPADVVAAQAPTLASGSDGRAWLAYAAPATGAGAQGMEIWICSWKKGEKALSKPILVAKEPSLMAGMHRGPQVATWGKSLAVSWINGKDLRCARSDDGAVWKDPVTVNAAPGSASEGLHAMAATSDGQLWCCWVGPGSHLLTARSKDGGASFENMSPVQKGTVCPCCRPSLASGAGGGLTVMFRNDLITEKTEKTPQSESRDLYVADLDLKEGHFGEGCKLGKGTWKIASCPMDGGGCAFGKTLVTVWRRDRMILATLDDTTSERTLGTGKDPAVATLASGAALAVWTDKDAIQMLRLGGSQGAEPAKVSAPEKGAKQGLPAVAPLSGGYLVAWEETPADAKPPTLKARWIPASP